MAVTILGIDVSLTCTGLAVAKFGTITETFAVKTKPSGDSLLDRNNRIGDIFLGVQDFIASVRPALAVIEAPSLASKYGQPHERSGVWWGIVTELHNRQIPVAEVAPTARAKYGTGKGNAAKADVHAAVKARYARLDLPIKTNDEADAVILAAMGARHLGQPVDDVSDDQLAAMEKVAWP